MAIFGKQLRSAGQGGVNERVTALEEHVRYMQEMLEYYARQTEKRLGNREKGEEKHGE